MAKIFRLRLLVLMINGILSYEEAEKACIAPKVVKGSSAKIACYFDRNTQILQENVFMEHLKFGASDHEIVVSCQVVGKRYVCTCNDGYQVVGNITNVMTVEISSALPEHAGVYLCGGFQPNPLERTQCNLNVIDESSTDVQISTITALIAVLMATTVACALIITVLIMWRRRARKSIDEKKPSSTYMIVKI